MFCGGKGIESARELIKCNATVVYSCRHEQAKKRERKKKRMQTTHFAVVPRENYENEPLLPPPV